MKLVITCGYCSNEKKAESIEKTLEEGELYETDVQEIARFLSQHNCSVKFEIIKGKAKK